MIDKKLHKSQLKAEYLTNFYERNLLKKYAADTVDSVKRRMWCFWGLFSKQYQHLFYCTVWFICASTPWTGSVWCFFLERWKHQNGEKNRFGIRRFQNNGSRN